jgi:hypothetical protein
MGNYSTKLIQFLFIFTCLQVFVSCGKLNPEDPFLPHFNHLNERLEGEWELIAIFVNTEDSSSYLKIDTMKIARYFKFVPTAFKYKLIGEGNLFIKSKATDEYPLKIGISQSENGDLTDTNFAMASLSYRFIEGSKISENYFSFSFDNVEKIESSSSTVPFFKPIGKDRVINNFYILPHHSFEIKKATKKHLVLTANIKQEVNEPNLYIFTKYRFEFKKMKE